MIVSEGNLIYDVRSFLDKEDGIKYFQAQDCKGKIRHVDTYGDTFSVIKSISSLTQKCMLCVAFESDIPAENSYLMLSASLDRWVVHIDHQLKYIQPSESKILGSCSLSTPLSGLYLFGDRVLVIEEAAIKITNKDGRLLQCVYMDLIQDLELIESTIVATTVEGEKVVVDMMLDI